MHSNQDYCSFHTVRVTNTKKNRGFIIIIIITFSLMLTNSLKCSIFRNIKKKHSNETKHYENHLNNLIITKYLQKYFNFYEYA